MTGALFNPSLLPRPAVLRRRHRTLALIDECRGGRESQTRCFYVLTARSGAELEWFETGGGDEYGLVVDGDEAVLWVFDHESPYSPWAHPDEPQDWPGMLSGLPDRPAAHLPEPQPDYPRSISACYWCTGGAWHSGAPEFTDEDPGEYPSDPQGVGAVIESLLDFAAGVTGLVDEYYEEPDYVSSAMSLTTAAERGRPVNEELIAGLDPVDGVEPMFERARQLGLA